MEWRFIAAGSLDLQARRGGGESSGDTRSRLDRAGLRRRSLGRAATGRAESVASGRMVFTDWTLETPFCEQRLSRSFPASWIECSRRDKSSSPAKSSLGLPRIGKRDALAVEKGGINQVMYQSDWEVPRRKWVAKQAMEGDVTVTIIRSLSAGARALFGWPRCNRRWKRNSREPSCIAGTIGCSSLSL
jgi:hypothetical protein